MKSIKGMQKYSGVGLFSSIIKCGECGSWYGAKVWHSNDKYRKVIYRCNNKYADGCKCKTPHINEDEYEKRYTELTARYENAKAKYDDIAEQIESKKAKRELFKGFIRTLEKQDGLIEEFDAGIWSSLVQEVIVKAKDDIRFIFKNGFEIRV